MASDPQERFKDLYQGYAREDLVQAGREHLASNLTLRARRHTRWFWIGFAACLVLAVWLAVLGAIYLLERAKASADTFERHRQERIEGLENG